MLLEHLSQEHDAASRRTELIDRHVEWISESLLTRNPSSILDLGCGPGLYANRLAQLGHNVTGIDFSPSSILYAQEEAERAGASCTFVLDDILKADYGEDRDLAMLIYGEYNTFRTADAAKILARAASALAESGQLLLEVHTEELVRQIGQSPETRRSLINGLFSDQPHEYVTQNLWDEGTRRATTRFIITDAETGAIEQHSQTLLAYTEDEYREDLRLAGFRTVDVVPSLTGHADDSQPGLYGLVAGK